MDLHIKNEWKGRDAYIADQKAKNKPTIIYRSGPPPLTLITGSIRIEDISTKTDHVGTSIEVNYNAQYTGNFDPIYITGNASGLGFPWYGDYYAGATGLVYCSQTSCAYKGG